MPHYAMLRSATQRNAMLRLALLRYLRDVTICNAMTCFSLSRARRCDPANGLLRLPRRASSKKGCPPAGEDEDLR
eukprot:6218595-Pyramimonas_sp.AAC.1